MNILDLIEETSFHPVRVSSTNGGEYKSGCPNCKTGIDRFCIWPNQGETGRYWCRVCDCKGDGIQFCRDFLGMSFQEACETMQKTPRFKNKKIINNNPFKITKFVPEILMPNNIKWEEEATNFVNICHDKLIQNTEALNYLKNRGFTLETIKTFSLGVNLTDLFENRVNWGLSEIMKKNGHLKRQWLPKGIVIPSYNAKQLIKIKIRRSGWHETDNLPKYVEIPGSSKSLSIYGDPSKPVIIVESELDAILIQQHASDIVCSIALGGITKKPDNHQHMLLKQASCILLSLDYDDVGKKNMHFG